MLIRRLQRNEFIDTETQATFEIRMNAVCSMEQANRILTEELDHFEKLSVRNCGLATHHTIIFVSDKYSISAAHR